MSDIGGASVLGESGDQAVVKVTHAFSATPGAAGTQCSGDGSRDLTLTKGGSAGPSAA